MQPLIETGLGQVGQYRLLEKLGQGGMGTVYKAVHVMLKRVVALKVLSPGRLTDAEAVARFHREMELVGRLSHSNVVRASDAGEADGSHFLVMEFVEGTDLARLVQRRGPLPVPDACEVARQAARGLQHVYEHGLVHRDLKPSNLMLTPAGVVKLLDLGLTLLHGDDPMSGELTETGQVLGTLDYLAPEQELDTHAVDIRADLYSLGCTLYHLLAGRAPFAGPEYQKPFQKMLAHAEALVPPVRNVRPEVPPELEGVLKRLLAKDPADRFATPAEVAAALEPFAAGCGLPALLVPAEESPPPGDVADRVTDHSLSSPARGTNGPDGPATQAGVGPPAGRARRRVVLGMAAALLLGLAAGLVWLAPIVIRIATNKGQLVLATDDPDVEITVKRGGEQVEILDLKTRRKIDLPAGEYEVALSKGARGLGLRTDRFAITRGGRTVVQVRWEPAAAGGAVPPGGVREPKRPAGGGPGPIPPPAEPIGEIRRFDASTNPLVAVALSPDGRRLVSGGHAGDGTLRVWDVESGKELRRIDGVNGAVWNLTFLPDGRHVLDGGPEHPVRVWDVDSGRQVQTLEQHGMRAIASPDGHRVLACLGNDAFLIDRETGKEARRFSGHTDLVWTLAFSPDGRRMLTGSVDRTMRLWDVESGQELRCFKGHTGRIISVAFSPDGRRAVSGGQGPHTDRPDLDIGADFGLRLWDLESGQDLRRFDGHTACITWTAFSPNGRHAATGSHDKTVRLWDIESGKELYRFDGHTATVQEVVFSPDGRRLFSASEDKTVRLWRLSVPPARTLPVPVRTKPEPLDLPPGAPLSALALVSRPTPIKGVRGWAIETQEGHRGIVFAVAYSPDGRWLTTAGVDGTVRLWEASTRRMVRVLIGHDAAVSCLAWSPDSDTLASGSADGTVRFWEGATGRPLRAFKGHTGWVRAVAWSADGKTLASAGEDGAIRLWATGSADPVRVLPLPSQAVAVLAWSPDGKYLATGGRGPGLLLWDVDSAEGRILEGQLGQVFSLAFSPDGRRLASGNDVGRTIQLWDVGSGQPLRALKGHTAPVWGLAWSARGKLASCGPDQTVRVWNPENGELLHPFGKTIAGCCTIAWSPDGNDLASGDYSGTVYLWDVAAGTARHTLPVTYSSQTALAWSPNGKGLAVCRYGGDLQTWDAEAVRLLHRVGPGASSDAIATPTWAADGRTIAFTDGAGQVHFVDGKTGQKRGTLKGQVGYVSQIAWSPDGKTLASGGADPTVRLWDGEAATCVRAGSGTLRRARRPG